MSKQYTYEEVNDVIDTDEIIKNAFIRIKECIYEEIINNIKDAELDIFDTHNDCIIDEVLDEFTIARKPKQDFKLDLIKDVEIEGIDIEDYPDFCDAFLIGATYKGRKLTEDELEHVQDSNPDWFYDQVWNTIH